MLSYFIKRLFWAIPTLVIISLLVFGLTKCTHANHVRKLFPIPEGANMSAEAQAKDYKEKAQLLGLDDPLFYCTVSSAAYPDTFFQIFPPEKREWLDAILGSTGQKEAAFAYQKNLKRAKQYLKADTSYAAKLARQVIGQLAVNEDLDYAAEELNAFAVQFPKGKPYFEAALNDIRAIQSGTDWATLLSPKIYWHGTKNQYHSWVTGMLRGDWGQSYNRNISVWEFLIPCIQKTVILNGISLFLAILLSIPLGLWLAKNADSKQGRIGEQILIALYAMPAFWLASTLVLCFATSFGFRIFKYSCSNMSAESTWEWFRQTGDCLILPIFCQTLLVMGVLALQMRASAVKVSKLDFVRTARAKGLTEQKIWLRHILPNAFFPMITIFAGVLPALFGGSVIIEYIFDIRGMGWAAFDSFTQNDYPVLFTIVMVTAFLTLLGTLLADFFYAFLDPRVRY